jgi:CelD/BcsL family acetyltransferase involved in cellulose biosynthesis
MPLERRTSLPDLPELPKSADGFFVTGLRADLQNRLEARHPGMKMFVRQSYQRYFSSLQDGFDTYLARFSAKTRSTLKRKLRKLSERSRGRLDVRSYTAPDQMAEFHHHARAVSATTYQERLLGAGLPTGEATLAWMRDLAGRDELRAWLLFLDGRPISYLFAPAEGDSLIYAYLGYDPAFAELSPGTVLQLEALRRLMEERRFRLFDFTEGDGQHKRQFATGSVECVDLLLLRPTPINLAIGHGLQAFDAAVERSKRAVSALGVSKLARVARR